MAPAAMAVTDGVDSSAAIREPQFFIHSVYLIGRHEFDIFDGIVVVQTDLDLEADPINGQDTDILD